MFWHFALEVNIYRFISVTNNFGHFLADCSRDIHSVTNLSCFSIVLFVSVSSHVLKTGQDKPTCRGRSSQPSCMREFVHVDVVEDISSYSVNTVRAEKFMHVLR